MNNIKFSKAANQLGSLSIAAISEKVNAKIKNGAKIFNFTIGDFAPSQFPIPQELEDEIILAYREKNTNYPLVGGIEELRYAISNFIKLHGDFAYSQDEIVVTSGARPSIYTVYKALIDPGDEVVNIVPSWNNYNYIELAGAKTILLTAKPENNFLPIADELQPYLSSANLIVLNSPLNPTGTMLTKEELIKIIDLVVLENEKRDGFKKPLYVLFDMIYWLLTYTDKEHYNPVLLNPKIREYIIFIDGISKCFAATGVRVGWAFGPKAIISKMRSILGHIGAWPAKPEQIGTAKFLTNDIAISEFLENFKSKISKRLQIFYTGFANLQAAGYPVEVLSPQGAIYAAVKIDLIGKKTPSGKILQTSDDIFSYLLEEAGVALVPFYAFGADNLQSWFRISVGTCSVEQAKEAMVTIQIALKNWQVVSLA